MKSTTLAILMTTSYAALNGNHCPAEGCPLPGCCMEFRALAVGNPDAPAECEDCFDQVGDSSFICVGQESIDSVNELGHEDSLSARKNIEWWMANHEDAYKEYMQVLYPDFDTDSDVQGIVDTYYGGDDTIEKIITYRGCV